MKTVWNLKAALSALALFFAALAFMPGLSASPALASLTTTGAGCSPLCHAVTYTGPGDVVAGAAHWWGLRAYSSAQADGTHAAANFKRASDSHTCDILLTTAGGLGNTASCSTGGENGTAVATWCASTTCSINTLYDQAGSTNANGTVGSITVTFNCIGTLPCMADAGSGALSMSLPSTVQPFTITTVAIRTSAITSQNDILTGSTGVFFNNSANTYGGYFGSIGTATASESAWHLLNTAVNGASSVVNVDGTGSTVNMGAQDLTSSAVFMFAQTSVATNALHGNATEVGVWNSALNSTQLTNMCHNQNTYFSLSLSC